MYPTIFQKPRHQPLYLLRGKKKPPHIITIPESHKLLDIMTTENEGVCGESAEQNGYLPPSSVFCCLDQFAWFFSGMVSRNLVFVFWHIKPNFIHHY